jgi:uncharacterized membrane protein
MKLFKHPIHVMLIHFPSALFPTELVLYFLFYKTANASFANASYDVMLGGVLLGWLAAITGFIDLILIKENNNAAKVAALIHGSINSTVLVVYSIFVYSLYLKYPALPAATVTVLLLKALLNIIMIAGNYLGGTLIFKYKIAIEN